MVEVGTDPTAGKRKMRSRGGFATKRAAEVALDETLQSVATGSHVAWAPVTLQEWSDRWWCPSCPGSVPRRCGTTGWARPT